VLALELMENGTADAEPLLTAYLQQRPSPEVRMAYARLLLEQQRYPEARSQLEAVTTESPTCPGLARAGGASGTRPAVRGR
jgi:predicted Zn-dependent protease